MAGLSREIFVIAAKRTPFGSFGGALKNFNQTKLQTIAAQAALKSSSLSGESVDAVFIGNVIAASSADGIYIPRHVALNCGVPIEKPALGVNRLCGSGFQSIICGVQDIKLGLSEVVLTGGVEMMSQTPFSVRNIRFGTTLGNSYVLEDMLWSGLTDSRCNMAMAVTAENLAEKFGISRTEADEYSLRSQKNWHNGLSSGAFDSEITAVETLNKGKKIEFRVDEHPRPNTTMETLSKLPPLFKKNGTVTAGTASGISDGASAVILASSLAVSKYNLLPLARIVDYSIVGVDPEIMGFGPVPAIEQLLNKNGLKMDNIDLVEINEAFAVQALACAKALDINFSKFNLNGGAIAIGHPLAASGSRITAHLVHELRRKNLKYGIGSACIGGGQGIALLLESCL